MNLNFFKKNNLPDKPGVYFFFKGKEIIYIGKATSLKDRVKSYFGKDLINSRGPILVDMVFQADKIKWQETDSVLEAFILEANLIKKHQPKYNTKEKSDKSFNYACIINDDLPKVIITRGKDLKKFTSSVNIFGPYTNSSQLKEALKIIRKIFPFLDDKSKNYQEFYKQINLIPNLGEKKKYLNNIKNIKLFFAGKKRSILKNLEREMKDYAKRREFEKAGEIKRQIFSLKHINDVALLKNDTSRRQTVFKGILGRSDGDGQRKFSAENFRGESKNSLPIGFLSRIEAYDVAHMNGKNMVGVMTVVLDGEIAKSAYKKFSARGGSAFGGKTILGNTRPNDIAALAEILERRFLHTEWSFPDLLVVDGGIAQMNIAEKVLKRMNIRIPIVSVLKNEHHKPKNVLGDRNIINKHEKEILLANSEAHRFAINYHKNVRAKNFLK